MVFSSMVFLWIFLPIVIGLYYISGDKIRNYLLLVASLIFYAWGEPVYIFLMLFSIVCNYIIGILIEKYSNIKSVFLVAGIIINIGLLGYFKYSNFLISIVNKISGLNIGYREIALPIGISFYTFQALSYVIDLYRGEYKAQKNFFNLALYISFFPQLIAGPIVKYKDINLQLERRETSTEKFVEGIRRFSYGLAKKVLIANTLAKTVDTIYALGKSNITGVFAWIAALCYTFQIYYDFSGYSDMAIGLGKMFGFDFLENFSYPYTALSIQDFWRKWHISLSSWFREYIYIPLGGNRKGKFRTYVNLSVVFFVTGLWHGAGFTFIIWGLYHGFFSIIERLGLNKALKKIGPFGFIYSFIVVNFGWVLFRADTLGQALSFIRRMLIPWKYMTSDIIIQNVIDNRTVFIFVSAIIGCGLAQSVLKKCNLLEKWKNSYLEMIYTVVMLVLCISQLASNTYNPFIYFRF